MDSSSFLFSFELSLRETAIEDLVRGSQVGLVWFLQKPLAAFRGSSALHAVGDSYLLLTRPSPQLATIELRFQFRYAAPQPPRLLALNAKTLWFASSSSPPRPAAPLRKVEQADVAQAMANVGKQARYTQLRNEIMDLTDCSKRTAQLAIDQARRQGWIVQSDGQYRLPL
jgi:hypothetical protein